MDNEYQNVAEYQNEEHKCEMVEEKLSHTWEVHSEHARTESVVSDQGYENDERKYEYIQFHDIRMRRLPEVGEKIKPALFGFKVGKCRNVGRKYVIFFVLLIFSLIMGATGLVMAFLKCYSQCPDDWQEFNEKCYYFSAEKEKWNKTRSACQDMDADLIVINNKKEQEFLVYKMNSTDDVWIGLRYIMTERDWKWVDGTNQSNIFWEPSETIQLVNEKRFEVHCVISEQKAMYKWKNVSCKKRHRSICEKKHQVVCVLQFPH